MHILVKSFFQGIGIILLSRKSADYIFWSFGISEFIKSHSESRVLLKPVLGGVAGVAHFSIGHEQTQYNRVSNFQLFDVFLASKGSNYSDLFISTATGVVPCGGHTTSSSTSS